MTDKPLSMSVGFMHKVQAGHHVLKSKQNMTPAYASIPEADALCLHDIKMNTLTHSWSTSLHSDAMDCATSNITDR